MSNPFEAPVTAGGGPTTGRAGDFDIGVALQDGFAAMQRNWIGYLGVWIAGGFAIVLALLMCILPAFVVIPVLSWGMTRFTLDTLDGEAQVGTAFEPFNRVGDVLVPMLLTLILGFLVAAPGMVASFILQFATLAAADGDSSDAVAVLGNLLGQLVSFAWSIVVVVRFLPMTYLVVEGGMAPVDAFSEAWRLTGTCWLKLMLFTIATVVIVFAGLLLCCVGAIPAGMAVTSAQASVYRQIIGRR